MYHSMPSRAVPLRAALMLGLLAISGCAGTPAQDELQAAVPLHDEAFPGNETVLVESSDDVFRLDDEVRRYLDRNIVRIRDFHDRGRALLRELFHQAELNLSYQSNANSTASETFHDRSANCLSLSILAYSMAEYAGFDARFQEVDIPDFWERRNGYSLMNRHVNLVLRPETATHTMLLKRSIELEVDFQPLPGLDHPPTRQISKQRALAMFYNNKAVDALLEQDDARAYAYLKAALLEDPSLDMALANLALLYRNHDYNELADTAYRQALRINPENMVAAEGLANVLRQNGNDDAAEDILQRVDRARRDNPWFQYILGEEAYDAGEWRKAIAFYRKALADKPGVDTFHFGMARAYLQLGNHGLAESHLVRAKRFSGYDDLKQKYQSKLDALAGL